MRQRFKNKDFNKIYWIWVKITPDLLKKVLTPGSNREQAFRDGYVNFRCKYLRTCLLYPIYVAGKEWKKINKQEGKIKKAQ